MNMKRTAQLVALAATTIWTLSAFAGPSAKVPLGNKKTMVEEGVRVRAHGANLRSVEVRGIAFTRGAHPTKTQILATFDATSGQVLTLKDLFGANTRAAVQAIARTSRASLKKQLGPDYYSQRLVPSLRFNATNFAYAPEGLRVGYQAPFVVGPQEVVIPWSKLPQHQQVQWGGL